MILRNMAYVGRFAPSPTGPLHFGSLVAAAASWLDARAAGGRWLLRMEDLDRPRAQPGAADAILRQLEALGLWWDGEPDAQSRHDERYAQALVALERRGLVYPCGCTRREVADSALGADGTPIYPGTCRAGLAPGKIARAERLRTMPEPIRCIDRIQGEIEQSVSREVGDFVLRRADGLTAYQLAVVVDDAAAGVTDVVRGADLLGSTPRQIYLQRLLGLPTPRYAHVPVAIDAAGEKLSKQTGAGAVNAEAPAAELRHALEFLGHPPDAALGPDELLPWALRNWQLAHVPRKRSRQAPEGPRRT